MPISNKIVIVGAGPAGLACATILAQAGHKVTLIEKNDKIGVKVCAGGITWNGQLSRLPVKLIQKRFHAQRIVTNLQNIILSSKNPILATVDRVELGQYMLEKAQQAGVEVLQGCKVLSIDTTSITCTYTSSSSSFTLPYSILIGADGANSKVRKYLNLPVKQYGIGIHYQLPVVTQEMQWHFVPSLFKNGYSWVFPHTKTTSVGAYADKNSLTAKMLMKNLKKWAVEQGFDIGGMTAEAERINYDYRGWNFGNIFLIGEAAGFASALTGEGINAAVQSGEYVAEHILSPTTSHSKIINNLLKKHQKHQMLVNKTRNSLFLQRFLPEILVASLRLKLIPYTTLEFTG